MIKGIDVTLTVLTQKTETLPLPPDAPEGTQPETVPVFDEFNAPVYEESSKTVSNVLVYPASDQEILDALNLYGKKAVYTLCIPKGDVNVWTNTFVEFFGEKWRTIGHPTEYIEANIPLMWNKKVKVESLVTE